MLRFIFVQMMISMPHLLRQ